MNAEQQMKEALPIVLAAIAVAIGLCLWAISRTKYSWVLDWPNLSTQSKPIPNFLIRDLFFHIDPNAELEFELAQKNEQVDLVASRLRRAFRLSRTEAKILACLADGMHHSKYFIEESCSVKAEVIGQYCEQYIYRLRKKIKPLKISNDWGVGYFLEGESLAAVQSIIKGEPT